MALCVCIVPENSDHNGRPGQGLQPQYGQQVYSFSHIVIVKYNNAFKRKEWPIYSKFPNYLVIIGTQLIVQIKPILQKIRKNIQQQK